MTTGAFSRVTIVLVILATFDLFLLPPVQAYPTPTNGKADEHVSVTRFREYLRLKAVHPNPDYDSSIAWIKEQAEDIGLEFKLVAFPPPAQFVIILTWVGTDQNLPRVLLNSHIDVVPVEEDKWTHDPFGAEKDEEGNIFGRGSQDMKSVGVQYLESIRNLRAAGVKPLRTVHVVFSPDEEVGGGKGIGYFVTTDEFKSLKVGVAFDEGFSSDASSFHLMYTERTTWQVEFKAEGQAGHASALSNNTAMEKIQIVANRLLAYREAEKERMEKNGLQLGDVTTINLTILKGGSQVNVVPSEFTATFDIRISPSWTLEYVQEILDNATAEAGSQVTCNFIVRSALVAETTLSPENPWWQAVQAFARDADVELVPTIMPAATDVRHFRNIGIPSFGFSPMNNIKRLAHDHNEYLNENLFLRGIELYEQLLPKLFNLD